MKLQVAFNGAHIPNFLVLIKLKHSKAVLACLDLEETTCLDHLYFELALAFATKDWYQNIGTDKGDLTPDTKAWMTKSSLPSGKLFLQQVYKRYTYLLPKYDPAVTSCTSCCNTIACFMFPFQIKIVPGLYDHLLSCFLTLWDIMRLRHQNPGRTLLALVAGIIKGTKRHLLPELYWRENSSASPQPVWLFGSHKFLRQKCLQIEHLWTCWNKRAGSLFLSSWNLSGLLISLRFVSLTNAIVKVRPGLFRLFCLSVARLSPQRVGSLSLPGRKRPVAPLMPWVVSPAETNVQATTETRFFGADKCGLD